MGYTHIDTLWILSVSWHMITQYTYTWDTDTHYFLYDVTQYKDTRETQTHGKPSVHSQYDDIC